MLEVKAYVDLPSTQLTDPNRSAGIFFGIDGLDRLTLLTAPLWGVTEIAGGSYMERLYNRLPKGSTLERRENDFELLLPDGRLLAFDFERVTHSGWNGAVIQALVLTSGQSPGQAAEILSLTPIRIVDAERRRAAIGRAKAR